jgi:hypothetical protein
MKQRVEVEKVEFGKEKRLAERRNGDGKEAK